MTSGVLEKFKQRLIIIQQGTPFLKWWQRLPGYIYCTYIYIPWKSKTKQRMVFRMIHVKDSLLLLGKVWFLDFVGIYIYYREREYATVFVLVNGHVNAAIWEWLHRVFAARCSAQKLEVKPRQRNVGLNEFIKTKLKIHVFGHLGINFHVYYVCVYIFMYILYVYFSFVYHIPVY